MRTILSTENPQAQSRTTLEEGVGKQLLHWVALPAPYATPEGVRNVLCARPKLVVSVGDNPIGSEGLRSALRARVALRARIEVRPVMWLLLLMRNSLQKK